MKKVHPIYTFLFLGCALVCLLPFMDAGLALLMGFVLALTMPHPFAAQHKKWAHILLQVSVVGLGFGMNIHAAVEAGKSGLWLTIASITVAIFVGLYLGRSLHLGKKVAYLISAGTAICGGSAIAAIAPLINAKDADISVAMGAVFLLNAVALFLFPWVGHLLQMSNAQFGLWAAIAIHDTSSVIGAAGRYSPQSLELATTVKLARALWIIPVSLITLVVLQVSSRVNAKHALSAKTVSADTADKANQAPESPKVTIPWFIFLFVAAVLINTYVPFIHPLAPSLLTLSKRGLILTLFLIGTGLSPKMIRQTGPKPLLLGVSVWAIIATGSLWVILHTHLMK